MASLTDILLDAFTVPAENPTVEGVAAQLRDLRVFKREVADTEAKLVTFLADILPGGGLGVPGVGLVEAKKSASKKRTDGRRLALVVAARLADEVVDRETGEIPPLSVVCQRVAEELVVTAGLDNESHAWRSGELKKRGIDVAKFVETEGGKTNILITEGAA